MPSGVPDTKRGHVEQMAWAGRGYLEGKQAMTLVDDRCAIILLGT